MASEGSLTSRSSSDFAVRPKSVVNRRATTPLSRVLLAVFSIIGLLFLMAGLRHGSIEMPLPCLSGVVGVGLPVRVF